MIFIERDTPYTRAEVDEKIRILNDAVAELSDSSAKFEDVFAYIRKAIAEVVPTYHDPDEVNQTAEDAEEMKLVGAGV